MKRIFALHTFVFLFLVSFSQRTAVDYYNDGMKYAERGNYQEAIAYFDMALRLKENDYFTYYNRGIAKSLLKKYTDAIEDFKLTLNYKPDYIKAFVAIGNCYKRLTWYDTAINYYSSAIALDTGDTEAYYHRAAVYESMLMIDSAVADLIKLKAQGINVDDKLKYYADTAKNWPKTNTLNKLTAVTTDATYGFTKSKPVKVGTSRQGGFENVYAYLNQLRDAKNKPVKYHRIGACCPYKAAGYPGNVLLEEYELTYTDEAGAQKTVPFYLTYYQFEAPQIPVGLKAAR